VRAASIIGLFTFTAEICTPNIEDPQSGIGEAPMEQEIIIFEVIASGSFLHANACRSRPLRRPRAAVIRSKMCSGVNAITEPLPRAINFG
jgi:hypothetical protein